MQTFSPEHHCSLWFYVIIYYTRVPSLRPMHIVIQRQKRLFLEHIYCLLPNQILVGPSAIFHVAGKTRKPCNFTLLPPHPHQRESRQNDYV